MSNLNLNIKKMKEGICLICGNKCLDGYFMHLECALIFDEARKKEKLEKKQNI